MNSKDKPPAAVAVFDSTEKLMDTITAATLIPNNSPCVRWGPYNRFLVATSVEERRRPRR